MRPRPDESFAASAPTAIGAGFGLGALIAILPRLLLGPPASYFSGDTYMRLVRLRDEWAAGHALQVVARDSSGHGTVLHWSHLLDSLLFVLATPLGWIMPRPEALHWAVLAVGPLSMGMLGAMLTWALLPLVGPRFVWIGVAAACVSPPVLGYGQAGVAHHHILLAVTAVALAGWTQRLASGQRAPGPPATAAGLAVAAWSVLGMWLSPEVFLAVFLAFGGLGWCWLRAPDTPGLREGILAAGLALPVLMLAALLVDPPPGGRLAVAVDHLSLLWVCFALVCAATALALARLGRTGALAVALGGGGLWLAAFPVILSGTDAALPPGPARALLRSVAEMRPVDTVEGAICWILPGLLAVVLLMTLAWRRRDSFWAYAALCGLIILALTARHVRFATYAALLGAAALPAWMELLTYRLAVWPLRAALARIGTAVIGCLFPWLVITLMGPLGKPAPDKLCHLDAAVGMLDQAAGQIVLTHPNYVPELLYRTRILTVGSLYLRGWQGLARQNDAWESRDWDQPGPAMEATGARYVLVCRQVAGDGDTLFARLARGEKPAWLREVASEPDGFVLFQRLD